MQRSSWLRRTTALVAVLGLAATACGGGEPEAEDTETQTETETSTETETEATETETPTQAAVNVERPERDEVLDYGYVLPETGPLAFLSAPQIAGTQLAIEDINAAGGVNDNDVTLATGDAAGQAAAARQVVASHINAGADVIIGAAASGVTQEIIQITHDNEIVHCSGSTTSPSFSDQENNDYFFRTVPPDQAVSPIIVQRVLSDGYTNVAVVGRADDYGELLTELIIDGLESQGATVPVQETYDPNTTDFSSLVSEIQGSGAQAVVVIGFAEAATLIRQLIEAGFPADGIYGGDGLFGPTLTEQVGVPIDGMTVIGASGGQEFNDRLNQAMAEDQQGNLIYGAQFYDCVIVAALASIAADSTDPAQFDAEVQAVTKDGTECSTFADCKELLNNGEDIDYQGTSGPVNLEGPDPSFGRYAIAVFQEDGSLEIVDSQDVDLGEVSSG